MSMTKAGMRFVAGLALAAAVAGAADMSIATVDAQRLLMRHPEVAQIDLRLERMADEFNAEGQRMIGEHKRFKQEFERARANAMSGALSETGRDKRLKAAEDAALELMECEDLIREKSLSRRRQLEDERRRMRRHIVDKIKTIIREYARERKFAMVLDSSGVTTSEFEPVLYAPETMDITAAIEERMLGSKPGK